MDAPMAVETEDHVLLLDLRSWKEAQAIELPHIMGGEDKPVSRLHLTLQEGFYRAQNGRVAQPFDVVQASVPLDGHLDFPHASLGLLPFPKDLRQFRHLRHK